MMTDKQIISAENKTKKTSIVIIILSILMIGLQYFGYQDGNIILGTIMLNLNIIVSFIIVILLVIRLITVIRNKRLKHLTPFFIGLIATGIVLFEPFNYTKHSIFPTNNHKALNIDTTGIRNGDIIFQTSLFRQSKAIQLATKSKYSHCGIIYKENNEFFVYEAVQPVKLTPFDKWIARGKDGKYVIKRLKNAEKIIDSKILDKMKQIGEKFKGKNYDLTFEWTDDKIYCSELIWKIYQRATGIEIGKLEKLKDFDLSNEIVKKIMKDRYGDNIPKEEIVISPVAIFDCDKLMTIKEN